MRSAAAALLAVLALAPIPRAAGAAAEPRNETPVRAGTLETGSLGLLGASFVALALSRRARKRR